MSGLAQYIYRSFCGKQHIALADPLTLYDLAFLWKGKVAAARFILGKTYKLTNDENLDELDYFQRQIYEDGPAVRYLDYYLNYANIIRTRLQNMGLILNSDQLRILNAIGFNMNGLPVYFLAFPTIFGVLQKPDSYYLACLLSLPMLVSLGTMVQAGTWKEVNTRAGQAWLRSNRSSLPIIKKTVAHAPRVPLERW